jgi:hypothetical protein
MKKVLLFLTLSLLFSSCSSLFYSNRRSNNTFSIQSNVKTFQVNFPYLRNESYQVNNGTFTHTLPRLSKKYMTVEIKSENYEPQTLQLTKTVRIVPLLLDILSFPLTFGIPVLVDIFKSDFYKIGSESKKNTIALAYTQSYMARQFDKIKATKSPEVLTTFINDYPLFRNQEYVIDRRDSLEFFYALSRNKEQDMANFVKARPSSKFAAKAIKIESAFSKSRLAFADVKLKNTVEEFEKFISDFPYAIQIPDAYKLLVDAAEKEAINSFTSAKKITYLNDYLISNKKYLGGGDFTNKKALIITKILSSIELESTNKDLSGMKTSYSNYSLLNKNNIDLSDLSKFSEIFQRKVSNHLFPELQKIKSNQEQLAFESKIQSDFPNLFTNSNTVVTILKKSSDKNGRVVIYNSDYLSDDFFDQSSSKKYKNAPSSKFVYKSNSNLVFENSVKQVLNFNTNMLSGVQENYLKGGLNAKLTISDLKIINEEYYLNNSLIGHNFYDSLGNLLYTYEYENGINLTLKRFDFDLKVYNNMVANKSLNEALEGYNQLLRNKFPQELSQNIELNNRIEVCKQLIAKKELEDERLRLVEEARQEKIRIAEEARQEKIRVAEEARQAKKDAQQFAKLMILLGALNQAKEKLDNPYGGGSSNREYSNNSSSRSNSSSGSQAQQKKCSSCSGSGRCRTCGKAQQDGYYDVKGSYIRINEVRPGMVICGECHGYGIFMKTNTCNWCQGRGWKFCRECNYNGRGSNAGQCQTCKGSGHSR